jgi:hypothetical protein
MKTPMKTAFSGCGISGAGNGTNGVDTLGGLPKVAATLSP